MNHRPVCVECHIEMRPEKNGVLVIETSSFGPYKVWEADVWKCPGCHVEIIAGFGNRPLKEHHEPGFEEWLNNAKATYDRVEYDNEEYSMIAQLKA